MATMEQLERALRNADAAGDTDAARQLAQEIQRMRSAPAPSAERPGALERGIHGVARGLRDPVDASMQMILRGMRNIGVVSDESVKLHEDWQQRERDTYERDVRGGQKDMDWGRVVGNVIGTAPLTMAVPTAGTALRAAGSGAASGAAVGAFRPVEGGDFLTEKLRQIGTGAVGGAIAGPVAHRISKMVSPTVAPEVAALRKEGVNLTPGQILGGGFKRAEDAATSVPIFGDAIQASQRRSIEDFNRAAINRGLSKIGQTLPKDVPVGREGVKKAGEMISQAYDDLLPRLRIQVDEPFVADVTRIAKQAASELPESQAKQFSNLVTTKVGKFIGQDGRMTGEAMKQAESELGRFIRQYGSSADPDQRAMASALREVQTALRDMVVRSNPDLAPQLRAINEAFANHLRVERAAAAVGAKEGVFTPAQLNNAVKALDSSLRKKRYAHGDAVMQDLTEAAQKVLPSSVPDSGTGRRLLQIGALGTGYLDPTIPFGLLTGASLYTRPMQQAMGGLLTSRQGPAAGLLAEGVRRLGPPAILPLHHQLTEP